MARPAPAAVGDIALLGTGTIGASWATYFLARGFSITAWDPAPDSAGRLRAFVDAAWPAMERLGLSPGADPARVRVVDEPEDAVEGAVFVQENAPEDQALKRALYGRIDPVLTADAVVASSSSGLLISALQEGFRNGARFVVGHPFNPPHLVPLVEVVGGKATDPEAVEWTARLLQRPRQTGDQGRARSARPYRQPAAGGALPRSLSSVAFGHGERRRHRRGGLPRPGAPLGLHGTVPDVPSRGRRGRGARRVRAVRAADGELVGRFRHAPPGRRARSRP